MQERVRRRGLAVSCCTLADARRNISRCRLLHAQTLCLSPLLSHTLTTHPTPTIPLFPLHVTLICCGVFITGWKTFSSMCFGVNMLCLNFVYMR